MKTVLVDIKNITVTYGATPVLRDVSVALPAGQLVVCIGPNGAGKSSLLRAIAGLIRPLRGTIQIRGVDVAALAPQRRAEIVTLVPQFIQLPSGFSVREVVEMARYARRPWFMGAHAADSSIVDAAMAQSDVLQFAHHTADRLSGGEQQRVAVARAIAQEPQVLLLDESTAHLDLQHQAAMIRIARSMTARGVTVVAAMHDLNLAAAHADAILLLDRGSLIVYGSPRDVLQQERLEHVYQTELVCLQRPDTDIPFFILPSSRSHATTRRTEAYTVADGGV